MLTIFSLDGKHANGFVTVAYGPYWKHVGEYWSHRNLENFLFLKYEDHTAYVDLQEYYIDNPRKIVAVLVKMID